MVSFPYNEIFASFALHYSSSFLSNVEKSATFPSWTSNSAWDYTPTSSWTVGFLPGILWQMGGAVDTDAQVIENLFVSRQFSNATHDLGFVIYDSFGKGLSSNRLSASDKLSFEQIIVNAATSLTSRYNANVGCIRSWNNKIGEPSDFFQVIIDNMMNLELLLKASTLPGGNAYFTEVAINHAKHTALNHIRSDYSTFHEVIYNTTNGQIIEKVTVQGFANNSTWSRGQSWAIYGFLSVYKYTNDTSFLDLSINLANKYISLLPSNVYVPIWDFNFPADPLLKQNQDSSAAVVVASAFIDLATILKSMGKYNEASIYFNFASQTYYYLVNNNYLNMDGSYPSVLMYGTDFYNSGLSNQGIIYGDYYLLEGLLKLQQSDMTTIISNNPVTSSLPILVQNPLLHSESKAMVPWQFLILLASLCIMIYNM